MYNEFIADISEIIVRDLKAMKEEVGMTPDEVLWEASPGIINPVGTLAYHICGNLSHFIGAVLGKDGYLRDRYSEFNKKDLTKQELLLKIDQTIDAIQKALADLGPEDLDQPMPDTPPQHKGRSVGFFLIQLCCHFSRHRGQLDYLRRMKLAR